MYKLLIATTGVLLTFAAGRYIMGIQFRPDGIQWGLLLLSTIAGLIGAIAIGWLLAGSMLVVDRMGWIWAEGFSGLLFMLSGAVIPLSVLPEWLRWVGLVLPISYWAEAWRIALFGDAVVKALPAMDVSQLWIGLIGTTAVWSGLALGWYHLCDRIASRWGRIDTTTFY